MDSIFQQADEALKGAERRPTAQKGGAQAPPKKIRFSSEMFHMGHFASFLHRHKNNSRINIKM